MDHRDTHLAPDLEVDLGRLGRSPARQQAQARDDVIVGLLALLVEEGRVEGGAAPGHGDAQAPVDLDHLIGHERLDEHGREPAHEDHHQVVGPGDVGEGKGDRPHVVGAHGEGHRQPLAAG